MNSEQQSGTLYIVATPIGNLEDISRRMEQTLAGVDLIASEDTRHTRKLLSHLNIHTPLTSYYREKEQQKAPRLLEKLKQGEDIALVSDAGTPGLSDPGAVLVNLARSAGIRVVPIPGPSALATAISVAGLASNSFYFGGFPPAKNGERKKMLTGLKGLNCPLIFYESPHRIRRTLTDCHAILGNRQAQIFRELSKLYEEHISGTLAELKTFAEKKVRGELVLIIEGLGMEDEELPENLEELILWYRDQGKTSLKDAARLIAGDLGLSRSKVYQLALSLWKTS